MNRHVLEQADTNRSGLARVNRLIVARQRVPENGGR